MGILRRAFERGKALPKKLERALKIQAGLALPDGQITDIDAYHINQRDEGIDLQGVSGALMATSNMQMQTFVTQASENTEGFDGYNGDLTGDVAATLGVNCGMSTGRNGVMEEKKNLCAPIPLSLHQRLRAEQEQRGQTLSDYITDILREHFEGGTRTMNANNRTIAFQVPEELFGRLKDYLARNGLKQKDFILGLIERELNDAGNEE